MRTLSLCACCRQYPGAAAGCNPRSSHPAVAAFPDTAVGSACTSTFSRLAWRSLALRPAHSRGHQLVTAIRRLQPFRYLHDCSDCFRRERIAGWDLHPLEKRRLFTAHAVSGRSRRRPAREGSTRCRPPRLDHGGKRSANAPLRQIRINRIITWRIDRTNRAARPPAESAKRSYLFGLACCNHGGVARHSGNATVRHSNFRQPSFPE